VDISINQDWRGAPAESNERVRLALSRASDPLGAARPDLFIEIDAPYHDDPPPPGAGGPMPGLWDFEVVELFLLGEGQRYLELEFGPHGHWLALELEGARNIVRTEKSSDLVRFEVERSANRWRGRARVSGTLLPTPVSHANAYAIHGTAQERRYLAWAPVPGRAPDFHQLDRFPPFDCDALRVRRSP
jgi:hypothetical protein